MKLLTEQLKREISALYSQDDVADPICVLKCFTPDSSFSWFIVEGSQQEDGDWLFFAKVVSHLCSDGELGYVLLSQLEEVRGGLNMPVERDLYWESKPLSQCK